MLGEECVDNEDCEKDVERRVNWKMAMLSEARAFEVLMYDRKVRSSAGRSQWAVEEKKAMI